MVQARWTELIGKVNKCKIFLNCEVLLTEATHSGMEYVLTITLSLVHICAGINVVVRCTFAVASLNLHTNK